MPKLENSILSWCCSAGCLATAISWKVSSAVSVSSCQLARASSNPATVSYDPAYGYEIAHIVRAGIERMYGGNHPDPNVMYYLTVYNEPLVQPAEPEGVDVDGIVRGMHRISAAEGDGPCGRARSCSQELGCRQ